MRTYQIDDQSPERDDEWRSGGHPLKVITWDELAEVNEPETMAEIDTLEVGDQTVLGQCDPIVRLT